MAEEASCTSPTEKASYPATTLSKENLQVGDCLGSPTSVLPGDGDNSTVYTSGHTSGFQLHIPSQLMIPGQPAFLTTQATDALSFELDIPPFEDIRKGFVIPGSPASKGGEADVDRAAMPLTMDVEAGQSAYGDTFDNASFHPEESLRVFPVTPRYGYRPRVRRTGHQTMTEMEVCAHLDGDHLTPNHGAQWPDYFPEYLYTPEQVQTFVSHAQHIHQFFPGAQASFPTDAAECARVLKGIRAVQLYLEKSHQKRLALLQESLRHVQRTIERANLSQSSGSKGHLHDLC